MHVAIEGIYNDGKIELAEQPAGVTSARVLVVFLPGSRDGDSNGRDAAIRRFFARANRGFNLGGAPHPKREEIYDRPRRGV